MIDRTQGHISKNILAPLITAMEIIKPVTQVEICRAPDDNKFLSCAKDSHSLYIVNGDKDLFVIEKYENIAESLVFAYNIC